MSRVIEELSMAKTKDFYGKSVAEALRQACTDLSISQEQLNVEVLETGSAGIFGLCKKKAHIRVCVKQKGADGKVAAPRKKIDEIPQPVEQPVKKAVLPSRPPKKPLVEDSAASEGPVPEVKPAAAKSPAEPVVETEAGSREATEPEKREFPADEVMETIRTDLDRILRLMGCGSEVTVHFDEKEYTVQCHITSEHEKTIVSAEGRTLDSLQYLLRKMTSRRLPDRMMLDVEAGNFRKLRIKELRKRAMELAEQVKVEGKTQAIPALNPSERRMVHMALQEDKDVRSRSVGEGLFKKVLIFKPGKGHKSNSRRRGRKGGASADK